MLVACVAIMNVRCRLMINFLNVISHAIHIPAMYVVNDAVLSKLAASLLKVWQA